MKTRITTEMVMQMGTSVQPVPIAEFCNRYSMDLRTGYIYDFEEFNQISPDLIDGCLMVTLETDDNEKYTYDICDLLLKAIYGYTNSRYRPKITEFPCNTAILAPRIHKFIEIDDNRIEINDIIYNRWLDSEYFVSNYGAIFSVPYGAFLRQYYNEKGYKLIHTKENGVSRTYKVHRFVWESVNGKIPDGKEIDHINDRRWDNVISNLQVLTHLENLRKKNPEVYKTYSTDTIINVGKDLANGISTKEIAEKYSISRARVFEIKFKDLYSDIISEAGIDLSNVTRDRKSAVTEKEIPVIIKMREDGISVKEIAEKYDVSISFIYRIINNEDLQSA